MKIEFQEERMLNEKEQSFIDTTCHNAMMEAGGDFNAYTTLRSSIHSQYQVFITPSNKKAIEDQMNYLILNLTKGFKKPVRGVVINNDTIGIQVFDQLRNKSLVSDAIGYLLNQFEIESYGDFE